MPDANELDEQNVSEPSETNKKYITKENIGSCFASHLFIFVLASSTKAEYEG